MVTDRLPADGTCRAKSCRQPIAWIETAASLQRVESGLVSEATPVCVDLQGTTGAVLRKGEKAPSEVMGYTIDGRVLRVVPGQEPTADLLGAGETATVWVTHFATCPARRRFRRTL